MGTEPLVKNSRRPFLDIRGFMHGICSGRAMESVAQYWNFEMNIVQYNGFFLSS